jgi:hypothetical protein
MSHRHITRAWLPAVAFLVIAACHGAGDASGTAAGKNAAGDKDLASGEKSAAVHRLAAGTAVELRADQALTSRHNKVGDPVSATAVADVRDPSGQTIIPRGAVFIGAIRAIAPAEKPGERGTLAVSFTAVRYEGHTHAIATRVTHLGTTMQGRGVTGGEVVKTGAGTAIGAVAGRIIGGNRTGTLVGAAAGTAAGAGYAAATRDVDVVLPQGGTIRLVLTAPLAA